MVVKRNFNKFNRLEAIKKAKQKYSQMYFGKDSIITQTVKTTEDLNKIINLLYERLTEWYAIYFPELKHQDIRNYCELILAFGDKKHPNIKKIENIVGKVRTQALLEKSQSSLGVDFSQKDLDKIISLAKEIINLLNLRDSLIAYQEKLTLQFMPNTSKITGVQIAAKLLELCSNLKRLATMPASTIQVLGAEKALFKHLKTGSKPPKHGVIFQHPMISTSPKSKRGRLSRLLASKISLALKADFLTKRDISDKLLSEFNKKAERILSQPIRKKQSKKQPDKQKHTNQSKHKKRNKHKFRKNKR